MEHLDRTDEEREELVKQFIKDYWLMGALAVLGAIGALYALNTYKASKVEDFNQSATQVTTIENNLQNDKIEEALTATKSLQTEKKETLFPVVATLKLAKKYFEQAQYDKAIEQYDWLISGSGDQAIRDIARLRKARAQASQHQVDGAINTLATLENNQHQIEAALLKGDVLLADNQFEAAQKAYETIKTAADVNPQLIEQRLNLVAIKQQQAKQ